MDIKRFDTYRGVCVDCIGTKGDVSVVVTDTKYVCKPKEDTAAYELYKQIESGEVIAVAFYYIKEYSGMDRILRVIFIPKADGEKAMDGRVLLGMSILISYSMVILGILNVRSTPNYIGIRYR